MNKVKSIFVGAVVAVVGIVVIFSASLKEKEQEEFKENAKSVEAYVEDVITETVRERYKRNGKTKYRTKTEYTAYFTYEVDGKEYSNIPLKSGVSGLTKGETVTIYYNSKQPTDIATSMPDPAATKTLMTVFGFIFVAVGGFVVYKGIKQ